MNGTFISNSIAEEHDTRPAQSIAQEEKSVVAEVKRAHHASRGQVLILLAGAMIALIGMLGLATDLGYSFAERRTMQNAADAGALAGAHALSKSDPASPISVLSAVEQAAWANKMGSTRPTITSCQYVDDTDTSTGSCSELVPPGTSGIRVTVKESHETFFVRALPGGSKMVSTSASATAHVQQLVEPPGDGPFIVCGVHTTLASGGNQWKDIVTQASPTSPWVVNPKALTEDLNSPGPTFVVFGPNISTCGLNPQNFKGQAVGTTNADLSTPGWFYYGNGDAAGHVNVSVDGVDGCTPALIINCVAFLPVAVDNPAPNTSTQQMWTVMILPFYLTAASYSNGKLNKLDAEVIGSYITLGNGKPGWIPGYTGPIIIKLTK